jgi:GNAT superfamily N-acetyltransferase
VPPHIEIRIGQDADADAFIALIGACWDQYPGLVLDIDTEMPELRALATYYAGKGGALWAAEVDGRIVGMVAARPHDAGAWEICRVYVLPSLHGSGLGQRLLDTAEAHALAAGAAHLVLWSDTRFERAHRFYEKCGYVRRGPIRALHDISNSLEFGYAKPLVLRRNRFAVPSRAC